MEGVLLGVILVVGGIELLKLVRAAVRHPGDPLRAIRLWYYGDDVASGRIGFCEFCKRWHTADRCDQH